MKQVRINIRTVANTSAIRKEKRNGRDVIIIPSATLPDDVIMNGIKYPSDEIAKSFSTLERTPAPLGHPTVGGHFVSARDPEGLNVGYVGAWNENVTRKDGRVFLDKVIDVEVANRTDGGKKLLKAVEEKKPIHTSTGLMAKLEPVKNADDHSYVAREMVFDHDAILLDQAGAATPDQGVGMFVNGEQIEVINSTLEERASEQLDWALESLARALETQARVPMLQRMKTALVEAFTERKPSATKEKADMADEKQLNELSEKVDALGESFKKVGDTLGETIANAVAAAVKPLADHVAQLQANQKAQEEAEKAELVNQVVKANLLDKDAAEELTVNALKSLASRISKGKAAPLNGAPAIGNNQEDEFEGYDLNSHFEKGGK